MAGTDMRGGEPTSLDYAQKRERQLDAISTIIALVLFATVALLLFFLSTEGLSLPGARPLEDEIVRPMVAGLILAMLLYIADQRRRLRMQVDAAMHEACDARAELDTTIQMLTFSHEAATMLAKRGVSVSLPQVLSEAARLYDADAAAVIGEEAESTFISEGVSENDAHRALMLIAVKSAGHPTPLLIQSPGAEDGYAISAPLRVNGELRYVLCMWNKDRAFTQSRLDSLGLMARTVELAIEREELLDYAHKQMEGTLNVLQALVSHRRPDYTEHAKRVAELGHDIGRHLNLRPGACQALRVAGLLHDMGIAVMSEELAMASKPLSTEEMLIMQRHPRIGAELAAIAGFEPQVQKAIEYHHERVNGSGYPEGRRGEAIPIEARILAVCEVYDTMTNRTYHGPVTTPADALEELTKNAGVLYDADAVYALLEVLAMKSGFLAPPPMPLHRPLETQEADVA